MGQWNPSVYDTSYSSKLPMGPMRKLAGFHSNTKLYFNTRTAVEPPMCLLEATPIGQWIYSMHDAVMADSRVVDHPTTMYVLRFFLQLNTVFLQDTTAMAVLYPERMNHPLYTELALFSTQAWSVSCIARSLCRTTLDFACNPVLACCTVLRCNRFLHRNTGI